MLSVRCAPREPVPAGSLDDELSCAAGCARPHVHCGAARAVFGNGSICPVPRGARSVALTNVPQLTAPASRQAAPCCSAASKARLGRSAALAQASCASPPPRTGQTISGHPDIAESACLACGDTVITKHPAKRSPRVRSLTSNAQLAPARQGALRIASAQEGIRCHP